MGGDDPMARYDYEAFVPEKFMPWMRFHESPPLGQPAPDFPLWDVEGGETRLSAVWSRVACTVVEFGSVA